MDILSIVLGAGGGMVIFAIVLRLMLPSIIDDAVNQAFDKASKRHGRQ